MYKRGKKVVSKTGIKVNLKSWHKVDLKRTETSGGKKSKNVKLNSWNQNLNPAFESDK